VGQNVGVTVSFEVADGVGVLTLCDPDRGNPMGLAMVSALLDAVEAAARSGVAVVVLQAQGRFFSVGGDLAAFSAAEDPSALLQDVAGTVHRAISQLMRLDAIVIAAVHGAVAGAGLSLVLACDLVVAAESAVLTMAYTNVGLSPDGGSTVLLPASLGVHRALQLALLNPRVSATQAHSWGLVAEVVADGAAGSRALQLAGTLAKGPVRAQIAAKHLLRRAVQAPETAMELEARSISALAAGAEGQEGMSAFLEKRPPSY
jgi:2-(1,2-epoxy-1,2-dihydrophenyl)acetyl-CoA isomerase